MTATKYFARKSDHIKEDIARGWSSWNFGVEGLNGSEEEIDKWREAAKQDDCMGFFISGFAFYDPKEIDSLDIRELYPNYWVLVDDRFSNSIAGIELEATTIDCAITEALTGNYTGDGVSIDVETAKLVWSCDSIHIFECNQ